MIGDKPSEVNHRAAPELLTASAPESWRRTAREPVERSGDSRREVYGPAGVDERRQTIALASAAHELKTPLSIIAGYVELLLTQKPGPLNERQRQILVDSQFSCGRLQRFVHDFLTFSALETGKAVMNFGMADLVACVSEVYSIWLARFQQKGVALYFPTHVTLNPFPFDYDKMQHVLSNLLDNALKYTPPGGTVWLTLELHSWERRNRQEPYFQVERRRSVLSTPNAVRVTVSDTGLGIAPEYHQEIFDEFVKAPQSEEKSAGGTGLGLAIARRLVQAHGGKIWVESTPAAGSRFSYLLPLKPGWMQLPGVEGSLSAPLP